MIRGTTPTHTFEVDIDTNIIQNVRVTYDQCGTTVLKKEAKECAVDGNTITVKLTQAETLLFNCKKLVDIQLHVLTTGGDALVSDVMSTTVARCLDNEVIE